MVTDVDVAVDDVPTDVTSRPGPRERTFRVMAHRVTGSSRARLVEATGCEIAADGDTSDTPVALIVVSTRM
ncbi:MAG: hypothetical protein WD010_00035, partial [Nitriliruptor sp.]